MNDGIVFRPYEINDIEGMLAVFNYFAVNSYAVYSEVPITKEQFTLMLSQTRVTLVIQSGNQIIGFGYISKFKPFPNFNKTGVLTYFILPEYTGKGIGGHLFNALTSLGRDIGITNYLANISSKNIQSLQFHKKMGFKETGLFKNVANKFNEPFDIVWVQKQFGE